MSADLQVTLSLTHTAITRFFKDTTMSIEHPPLKSGPIDFSYFWHVIRVMIGHDLTDKETMTNIKTFREQPPKRLVTL